MLCLLALTAALLQAPRPIRLSAGGQAPASRLHMLRAATGPASASRRVIRMAADADALASAVASCMAMRPAEIKAELDLRKIPHGDLFEKAELASRLARARIAGRADPSILDSFNRASAESAFQAPDAAAPGAPQGTVGAPPSTGPGTGAPVYVEDVTAADGALPGGMRPDQLQALASDPEVMAMLRNPRMQEVLREVMANGPDALQTKFKDDVEVRAMLKKAGVLFGLK